MSSRIVSARSARARTGPAPRVYVHASPAHPHRLSLLHHPLACSTEVSPTDAYIHPMCVRSARLAHHDVPDKATGEWLQRALNASTLSADPFDSISRFSLLNGGGEASSCPPGAASVSHVEATCTTARRSKGGMSTRRCCDSPAQLLRQASPSRRRLRRCVSRTSLAGQRSFSSLLPESSKPSVATSASLTVSSSVSCSTTLSSTGTSRLAGPLNHP